MKYVWETEVQQLPSGAWHEVLHLKHCTQATGYRFDYFKVTAAYVFKVKNGVWRTSFTRSNDIKTFRSCKAAKAYAVAIVTLSEES